MCCPLGCQMPRVVFLGMACDYPLEVFRRVGVKRPDGSDAYTMRLTSDRAEDWRSPVPCGSCTGCLLDKRSEWIDRAVEECRGVSAISNILLTYRDAPVRDEFGDLVKGFLAEHCVAACEFGPVVRLGESQRWTLVYRHVQLALKHLRRELDRLWKMAIGAALAEGRLRLALAFYRERPRFKYMLDGEYGPLTFRPHWHVLMPGWYPGASEWERWYLMEEGKRGWIADYRPRAVPQGRRKAAASCPVFESGWFNRTIWKYGYARFQRVDGVAGAAGYVAGYLMKRDEYPRDGRVRPFIRTSMGFGLAPFRVRSEGVEPYGWQWIRTDSYVRMASGKPPREVPVSRYWLRFAERFDPAAVRQLRERRRVRSLMDPRNHPEVRKHYQDVAREVRAVRMKVKREELPSFRRDGTEDVYG